MSRKLNFSQRGGWWVVGQLSLLLLILIVPGPRLTSGHSLPALCHLIGGALILIASLILLAGAIGLKNALTPYPYPRADAQLIREGMYRFIRHPLYFGLILGGFGVAFWRMNILSAGLSAILGVFLNAKANREEVWLLQKFPEYEAYRKKTKKIIPFIY